MDALVIETLRQDVQQGRITVERLVDLIESQQRTIQAVLQRLQAAEQRCEELEKKAGGPPTTKLEQPFSMRSEEKRQAASGKRQEA